jgi:hypothetical protein
MATGSQKVKTPTGWNSTRGAWVKTASNTWKDVDQIYIKTPSGWNNASGQEATQIPYPYIANAQNPFIRDAQQPYPYIANAQNPVIRDAQQPYPYIANAQSPYIAQARQPSTYQHRSPLIYQNPVSAQEPNIRSAQEPNIRSAQEPNIRAARQPFTYNYRSPSTYRNPVNYRLPFTYNYRSPFTYRNPVGYQLPFTYQHRVPFTYRNPVNGRQPNIASARTPFTYQARQPAIVRSPRNAQQPAIAIGSFQTPYPYTTSAPGGGDDFQDPGCFAAGSLVWLADGSHAPIESIREGQYVWSWNEKTNMLEPREVYLLMAERICPIYDISLSDGRIIQTTGEHPIKIAGLQGWGAIDPELAFTHHDWLEKEITHQLEVDSKLFSMSDAIMFDRADSEDISIIDIKENSELPVYNISGVRENNNYFVNGLLVHNFETGFVPLKR